MNRKGRYRATPQNPLPATRHETSASEGLRERGTDMAGDGYEVLDRASRYTKERRGFGASPVSDDPGYDDDGHFGYLT
jgi:hypothetical protein